MVIENDLKNLAYNNQITHNDEVSKFSFALLLKKELNG